MMYYALTQPMVDAALTGDQFLPLSSWGVELADGQVLK